MYFAENGAGCTRETARAAVEAARKRGIPAIVAASNTGRTMETLYAEAAAAGFQGRLVCVSHVYGFRAPGENELSDAERASLEARGIKVCTAAHALSGAERAISGASGGAYPVELIAASLRMFGSGVKVGVEIAAMALDAGLIPCGKPVIAVGGTRGGADTAIILTPSYTSSVLRTKIHEILCKPYEI